MTNENNNLNAQMPGAAPNSKDIWDYVSLPQLNHQKEMFRRSKFQIGAAKKKRYGNTKGTGSNAEDRVALQLSDCIGWACTPERTQGSLIDLFAISLQPPYKIALLQVKSAYEGSRTVHVDAKHLEFDIGPIWIIVVETESKKFEYLVFSHPEFKKFVLENGNYYGIERGYSNPEYDLSIPPKNLEYTSFGNFIGQWWKIEKNAKLYVK